MVCRDSCSKWRNRHPDYQRRYRTEHPEYAERNRQAQRRRDRKRRLRDLVKNNFTRRIRELLALISRYGPEAAAAALAKAQAASAFAADYVANILLQESNPRSEQPPLELRDPRLAELATDPLSLLAYDTFILAERNEP